MVIASEHLIESNQIYSPKTGARDVSTLQNFNSSFGHFDLASAKVIWRISPHLNSKSNDPLSPEPMIARPQVLSNCSIASLQFVKLSRGSHVLW